jgi:hypothetical protein
VVLGALYACGLYTAFSSGAWAPVVENGLNLKALAALLVVRFYYTSFKIFLVCF